MTSRLTRGEQREHNRTRLLDAAERVFAARGYRVASVDEVAEAAGLTKGAVYSQFASKEELFAAAVQRRYEERLRAFEAAMTGDEALDARAALAATDFTASVTDGADWALLFLEAWAEMLRNPGFGAALRELDDDFRSAVAGVVERTLSAQRLEVDLAPEVVAEMIIATTHGFGIAHRLHPDHATPALFADLTGALLAGIALRAT